MDIHDMHTQFPSFSDNYPFILSSSIKYFMRSFKVRALQMFYINGTASMNIHSHM